MKNFIKNLKVRKKILLIISINLFFTVLMTIVSNYSLRKIDAVKEHIVKIGLASNKQLGADKMRDAINGDVLNSFMLAQSEASEKVKLKKEFAEHVNEIKSNFAAIKLYHVNPNVDENHTTLSSTLKEYVTKSSELINKTLYYNLDVKSGEGKAIYNDFLKSFRSLEVEMGNLGNAIEKEYLAKNNYLQDYSKQIQYTLVFLALIVTLVAVSLSLYVSKLIETPVLTAEKVLADISSGIITEPIAVEGEDESAHMLRSLNKVVQNLENVKEFVTEVGQGNFDSQISIFENKGQIFNSLQSMSEAIQSNVEAEKKRNWTSEGLAKFVDITRDIQDVDVFYNNILSNLIRYVNANQGYLYVINDDNPELPFMETKAVYAYGKQRYLEEKKEIYYKQGLVGQAWFDKEPLYFTEIPTDFVNITSGIGEATPTCVFIVPLLVNETIYGVIEIASFQAMKDYEKDFVIKLSETIASTVSSAKTNERTKKLLHESQEAQQAMIAQEEEIRQNMEEMQATQAEMERMQRKMMEDKRRVEEEFEAQLKIIDNIAIVSKTDVQGNITYVNDNFCKWAKYSRDEVMGLIHRILKSGDQDDAIFDEMWKTISSGRIFRGEIKNKAKDGSFYWVDAIIAPVLDGNGKPKEYIAQRFIINDQIADRERMQQVLEETRAQEEEIRQNMEEMTAIQEQMEMASIEIQEKAAETQGIVDGINATMATIEFTPDGIIVDANDNFLHTMKCTKEEIVGKHHQNFVPNEIRSSNDYKHFWSNLASGKSNKGIFKRLTSAGETVWLDAIYNPIFDVNGKVIKVLKFANDVTLAKEQESELQSKMNGINSTMATIEFTPEGNVITANDNFLATMKCTMKDIYGKHHKNFVPKEIKESEEYETFWTRLAAGIENQGTFKRINAKGETVWLDAIYSPITNAEGKVVKVIKFAKDITAKVEADAESKAQTDIINELAIVSKTDLQGNITYVNPNFLTWSKYTEAEVLGKNHRILKSGDQDDQIFVDMWKTISSGKVFRGEIKNKAKDGSFYWVDAIVAPIIDENGKPKEYIAQRFVINEQKQKEQEMQEMLEETRAQEEEIRQNMEELTTIQEQMEISQREIEAQTNIINSVAIVSKTDLAGNITYVNEEFLKWSKYSMEEVMGQNHRMLKSGDQEDQIFVDMWKTISSGKIFRGEIKNKAKDGSFYWVDAIIAPVLDENGKPKEYIAQRFVINDQKEKEAQLNELLRKLDSK